MRICSRGLMECFMFNTFLWLDLWVIDYELIICIFWLIINSFVSCLFDKLIVLLIG